MTETDSTRGKKSVLVRLTSKDEWSTPLPIWREIAAFLPPKLVWQPFYYDGTCANHLRSLGWSVVHEDVDFFTTKPPRDALVVDNPPFSKKRQVLQRLVSDLDQPFLLIVPVSTITTQYFRKLVQTVEGGSKAFHFLFPKSRMKFDDTKNQPPFACIWLAYKCPWLGDEQFILI